MKYLVLAARLIIGVLFVYASLHKVLDPRELCAFHPQLYDCSSGLEQLDCSDTPLDRTRCRAVSYCRYSDESFRPAHDRNAGSIPGGLDLCVISIGLDIDCGCFTSAASSGGRIGLYHLARDSSLFIISLFILVSDRGDLSLSNFGSSGGRLRFLNA